MMEKITDNLKKFILENVEIRVNDKILRKGKLKVFNTKQFFINFVLIDEKENEREYKLPYPYSYNSSNKSLEFDYCLSAFCPRTEEAYWKMKMMDSSNSSRLHEEYLHIDIVD